MSPEHTDPMIASAGSARAHLLIVARSAAPETGDASHAVVGRIVKPALRKRPFVKRFEKNFTQKEQTSELPCKL